MSRNRTTRYRYFGIVPMVLLALWFLLITSTIATADHASEAIQIKVERRAKPATYKFSKARRAKAKGLLEDYLHLSLSCRPSLTVTAGEALLRCAPPQLLAEMIMDSPGAKHFSAIIKRVKKFPTARETAMLIEDVATSKLTESQRAKRLEMDARQSIAHLINRLANENPRGDWAARDELARRGNASVSALVATLKNKRSYVREGAAYTLGRIGSAAKKTIPALTEVLKDERKEVRLAAQHAIKQIQAQK